jgi:hypothetical protein
MRTEPKDPSSLVEYFVFGRPHVEALGPDCGFLWFSTVPLGGCCDDAFKITHNCFLPLLTYLLTYLLTLW